jgi:hypothetical protein
MLSSCLLDPMVQNRKVKLPFGRFHLLPGNGHQHGVDVSTRDPWQNAIGLRVCSRRGITQLAAEYDERLACDNQLCRSVAAVKVRNLLRGKMRWSQGSKKPSGEQRCGDRTSHVAKST